MIYDPDKFYPDTDVPYIPERYQYRMQRYDVYKDNDNCYTVWGYPHIVMWEFDNETDAKHCAEDLNKEIAND